MFKNTGFSYYELPPSLEGQPVEFQQVSELWQSKYENGIFPSWDAFDFYDFKGLHGWITLSEITFDPTDVCYRLFGSKITEVLGEDLTGKRYSETGPNVFHWQGDLDYFAHNFEKKTIGYAIGDFERVGYAWTKAAFLDIPLPAKQNSADQPSHILTVMHVLR
ncbi:hypothetical protein ACTL6U_04470 [Rhodovibrionaceae bacterium A322]